MYMAKSLEVLVDGGKATAAPPLGPALGPLGVNIGQVVAEINKKTASFQGMKVPVKISVDDKRQFTVEVGTPPVASLLLKESGADKGSGAAGKARVADVSMDVVNKVAKAKFGSTEERFVTQVIGTARSMGISVGKGPVPKEELKAAEEARKQKVEVKATPAEAEAAPAATEKPAKPAKK